MCCSATSSSWDYGQVTYLAVQKLIECVFVDLQSTDSQVLSYVTCCKRFQ